MTSSPLHVRTRSVEDTRDLGAALGAVLASGDVVALSGDLGAGKTSLVQGVARGLGSKDHVGSPTFTLVREYEGRVRILHMDVYRLDRIQDVFDLGFDEIADPDAVLLIEWGDAIENVLPVDHLLARLSIADDPDAAAEEAEDEDDEAAGVGVRHVELRGFGPSWAVRWPALSRAVRPWVAEDQ